MIVSAMNCLTHEVERNNKGASIEQIQTEMVNMFGKDKLCEMTGQPQVLTFEGQLNPTIMRNITKKV